MTLKEKIKGPHSSRREAFVVAAGFACLYTVAVVFFYYDWLFDLPGADPLVYGMALNGSLIAAATAVIALSRAGRLNTKAAAAVGTACYLIALACVGAASATGSLAFTHAAAVTAGGAAGALMPLWFDRTGLLERERAGYVLGAMSLVSGPAALVLDLLPAPAMVVVCGALVLVSAFLLAVTDRPEPAGESGAGNKNNAEAENPLKRLAAPLVYVFLLSAAYGVLDVVAMASPAVTAEGSGFFSQLGGMTAIVVFLVYVRFGNGRYATLLNVALALIATGLVFLPFAGGTYSVALVVLTHSGWEIALLVLYALVVEVFRGNRMRLIAAAALVFAFPRPGVIAGWIVASLVGVDNQFAFAQMTIVAFALIYLLLMGAWLLRTREKRAAERALRKREEIIERYVRARDEVQTLACDELAEAHNLTKREAEILKLLAQGRDAAHIEQELFLSRNTVKSYTKSLYAKLGVHSKQEVIDLVKTHLTFDNPAE